MKIGIDIQPTVGNKTGIGYYIYNLTQQLLKIDKDNEYFLFKNENKLDFSTLAPLKLIETAIFIVLNLKKGRTIAGPRLFMFYPFILS